MFIAALFTIVRTWKQPVSNDRWMDKDVAHIYNGILLSHKKKWNSVICSELDGCRVCHTEWSKSERENQILYANTCIWNLKKKNVNEEPRGRAGTMTQTYRMDLRTQGVEVLSWDEVREWHGLIYTTIYKIDN